MGSNKDSKPRHKPNSSRGVQTTKFEGSNPQMIGYYYTHNPQQQAVDQYQRTTEKLIVLVCSSFKEPQLLKACIKNLSKDKLTEPLLEENGFITDDDGNTSPSPTRQDELKYNNQFKEWQARTKELDESLSKTFTIIHGQCNRAMKAKIEEDPKWDTIDSACDPIGLLNIIKSVAHNNETQRNPIVSLILAQQRLMNMKQGDNQSNESYRLKFENQAGIIQNMGAELYQQPALELVSKQTFNKDYNSLKPGEQIQAKETATDLWKATLFITNSNPNRFDQLKKELHNQYISGDTKCYPTTFNDAYNRLNQHKSYAPPTVRAPSEGNSFAQQKEQSNNEDSDSESDKIRQAPAKYSGWKCAACNERGHPPSPQYCKVIKARNQDNNKTRDQLKNAYDCDQSESDGSKSRSSKPKKNTKESSTNKKKRQAKEKADIITAVLAQFDARDNSSSDSNSESYAGEGNSMEDDDNAIFQFCQHGDDTSVSSTNSSKPDSDPTDQPMQNHRSAQPEDKWTVVCTKNKKGKFLKHNTIHTGYRALMTNGLGDQRSFEVRPPYKTQNQFTTLNLNEAHSSGLYM